MRASNLPSMRGYISVSHQLRLVAALALSQIEVYAKNTTTLPPAVTAFEDFVTALTAAITAIKAYPASIVASAVDVALQVGADTTEQIVVTKTPLSGSTSNVAADTVNTFYTSSNTGVITVSATGLVTVVAAGSATVTVKHKNKTSNALAFTVAAA